MRPALPTIVAVLLGMLAFDSAVAQIVYPDFSIPDGLQNVGNAVVEGNRFRLTESAPRARGAFWAIDRQLVRLGFTTRFRFRTSNPLGDPDVAGERGGDGFAFVVQTSGNRALGDIGGTIGYHGIQKYVAVEFDTYQNSSFWGDPLGIDDSSSNQISVQPNDHRARATLGSVEPPINLSDGAEHEVLIEYRPGTLKIYLDSCNNLILTAPLRLENYLTLDGGTAWVGFTASTGNSWEQHEILSWYFNPQLPDTTISVPLCEGSTALLRGPNTAARHTWSTGASTPDLIVDSPGTYWVDLEDTLGCSVTSSRWTYVVTPRTAPRPIVSPSGTVISCGSSTVLTVNPAFQTYNWSTGAAGRSLTVTKSGRYWVRVTDAYGCTAISDTVTVKVLDRPKVKITALDPVQFCQGDSVRLDAGPGFTSYRWSTGETTRSITVKRSSSIFVTVTDSTLCDSTTPLTVVSVVPVPTPRIVVRGSSSPCKADTLVLDAGPGFSSYRWSTGETTQTIVVRSTSTVWVAATNSFGCEGISPVVNVTVGSELPPPEVTTDGPLTICEGAERRLSAPEGFAAYEWSTGETTSSIVASTAGAYSVRVVDAGGCEARSHPVHINVVSPAPLQITVDGDTLICAGESRTLSASPGFASYLWSNGSRDRTITVDASGRYSVQGVDANGCSPATAAVTLTVGTTLSLAVAGDTTICAGESVRLRGEHAGGIGSARYQWSPSAGLSCDNCPDPVATPDVTTRYILRVVDEAGCSVESAVTVAVNAGPARVNASMGKDLSVRTGQPVVVPIDLHQSLDGANVGEIILTVRYSGSPIRFAELLTRDALTDGWIISPIEQREGYYKGKMTASPSNSLSGTGRLVDLSFETFVGSSREATVSFDLELPGVACTMVETAGTTITLDSTCGINLRLIEASAHRYSLSQNFPNPVSTGTRIPFTIGLDGATRVEIVDGSGVPVALLVDEYLQPGSYEVTWDAALYPAGIYTCLVRSGDWRGSSRIVVVQ